MNRSIVIATDFSEASLQGISLAAQLARKAQQQLVIAHVAEQHNLSGELGEDQLSVEDARYKKWLDHHMDQVASLPALNQVKWIPEMRSGKVLPTIQSICEDHNASLLVMGNKGRVSEQTELLGSTAIKAVRNSEVPVLTVDKDSRTVELDKILFISDFRSEGLPAFHGMLPFLRNVGKEMHLLKVITPMNFESSKITEAQIERFAKNAELTRWHSHHFNARSLEVGIAEFLETHPMDMVVIETHGRKGLGHYFHGSHAESVVEQCKVPVLTMRMEPQAKGDLSPELAMSL